VVRQAGERRARLARDGLGWDDDRVRGRGLALPRGALALHMPGPIPIPVPVPVPIPVRPAAARVGGEGGPDAVPPTALGRGALVDRGDDGLGVGPVVRPQDQGGVRGGRGELWRGRDERLEIGAFSWRHVTQGSTKIRGGFASLVSEGLRRVWKNKEISRTHAGRKERRTDDGITEDDEEGGIVDPLDLEAAAVVFKLGEGGLDVPRLELGWETREREDAGNAGGERHG
jgi:hypothetical protein